MAITAVSHAERINALWKEHTTFRRVRLTAKSDYQLRHTVYICPSVCNNSASTRRIFTKSDIPSIFLKYFEEIQVSLKSDKNNNGHFTLRRSYFSDDISTTVLLIMGNVQRSEHTIYIQ
jgi:hypothetical protein